MRRVILLGKPGTHSFFRRLPQISLGKILNVASKSALDEVTSVRERAFVYAQKIRASTTLMKSSLHRRCAVDGERMMIMLDERG